MTQSNSFLRGVLLASLPVLMLMSSACGCFTGYHPDILVCKIFADFELSELSHKKRTTVFETPGTIIVFHGTSCVDERRSDDVVRVQESVDLPPYATDAAVFLNGWRLRYLSEDHHVAALGTMIGNIALEGRTLKWHAGGVLSDQNNDDSYLWCYTYTVVAWNSSQLNLMVDQNGGVCEGGKSDPIDLNVFFADSNGSTALSSFSTFLRNPNFVSGKTVAIAPRGFAFMWAPQCTDHHLLQIGINMDHVETFIRNGAAYKKGFSTEITPVPTLNAESLVSQVGEEFVSWETTAILKDSADQRRYIFGELVSGFGGSDVGLVQPPFSILPATSECPGAYIGPPEGVHTDEYIVENVPFEFAIPMLTGWDLAYPCEDEHVREIGIWLDEWAYDSNTHTLRYKLSSILRDKTTSPGHIGRHKVTILGLKPAPRLSTLEKVPDLVPFSPLGSNLAAFCRREGGGKQLRVTVKNQGNENAAASKTTVTFGNTPIIVNTPAIPAGGSVDLLFSVPGNCSPDCSFKITVDSANQVNESSHEGNNSANGGCPG